VNTGHVEKNLPDAAVFARAWRFARRRPRDFFNRSGKDGRRARRIGACAGCCVARKYAPLQRQGYGGGARLRNGSDDFRGPIHRLRSGATTPAFPAGVTRAMLDVRLFAGGIRSAGGGEAGLGVRVNAHSRMGLLGRNHVRQQRDDRGECAEDFEQLRRLP